MVLRTGSHQGNSKMGFDFRMIDKLQKCPICKQEGMLNVIFNEEDFSITAMCLSSDCVYEGKFYL